MTLRTPWTLIDPDGASGGILARIVTDREMGHVAVFDDPETARTVVETMNRAESAEQERRELERELAETRAKLARAESMLTEWPCTPAERAVLDAMASRTRQWLLDTIDHFGENNAPAEVAELTRRGEKP